MDFQHHCQFIILLNVERFSKMFPLMLLFRTPRLTISASEDLASSLLHMLLGKFSLSKVQTLRTLRDDSSCE
uniref:Uncharacterized protein n=1 Tax=Brassica oleracea TaxID=3712 RepID=A0A3P6FBC6_BRAOL|nr:unnamed protein product [Brassica oleracea]